jgi:hypothetical protein
MLSKANHFLGFLKSEETKKPRHLARFLLDAETSSA